MAIKTKEEMFGDGAGFGAQVPVSTTNPAGHGAGNRGIAFGEQVTAAVANRTHWALALNDEDLDGRIVVFETDGLDAAYDLGATATPGGGRVVTKDAGAIETRSSLAANYADDVANAHFRANARSDTSPDSVGFDYVSDVASSRDGFAGLLDRRPLVSTSGDTVIDHEETATLNPSGAGGDIIRINSGGSGHQYYAGGGGTKLCLGYDLVEITDTAHAGLYLIDNLGPTQQDVRVRTLSGTAPSFASSTAATIRHYRPKAATIGHSASRTARSTVFVGALGSTTVIDVVTGAERDASSSDGAAYAMRVRRKALGVADDALTVDAFGSVVFGQPYSDAQAETARIIFTAAANATSRYTLIEETLSPSTSVKVRRYISDNGSPWGEGAVITTFNARWDQSAGIWIRDNAAFMSWITGFGVENLSPGDYFSNGPRTYVRSVNASDGWSDVLNAGGGWQTQRDPAIDLWLANWGYTDVSVNAGGITFASGLARPWAIAGDAGGSPQLYTSAYGYTWSARANPGSLLGTKYQNCATLNGRIFAWTESNTGNNMAYSTDGATFNLASKSGIEIKDMAYGNSAHANYRYVAVGAYGGVAQYAGSADETTWAALHQPFGTASFMNVIHWSDFHNHYIAGGAAGTDALWKNPDGQSVNWQNTGVNTGTSITSIAEDDNGVVIAVAGDAAGSEAYRSTDLTSWTALTLPVGLVDHLFWARGYWFLTASGSWWVSASAADGTWEHFYPLDGLINSRFAYGQGMVMAFGNGPSSGAVVYTMRYPAGV